MTLSPADEGLTIPDAPTEPGVLEVALRAGRDAGRKLLVPYVTSHAYCCRRSSPLGPMSDWMYPTLSPRAANAGRIHIASRRTR